MLLTLRDNNNTYGCKWNWIVLCSMHHSSWVNWRVFPPPPGCESSSYEGENPVNFKLYLEHSFKALILWSKLSVFLKVNALTKCFFPSFFLKAHFLLLGRNFIIISCPPHFMVCYLVYYFHIKLDKVLLPVIFILEVWFLTAAALKCEITFGTWHTAGFKKKFHLAAAYNPVSSKQLFSEWLFPKPAFYFYIGQNSRLFIKKQLITCTLKRFDGLFSACSFLFLGGI